MKDIKVIFMGTPDFAVPILNYLIAETNVIMVVTKPDAEIGRNHELSYSPIKKVALEHNIEVYQPEKLKKEYEPIIEKNADVIITCAYGKIIPEVILDAPRLGCINVHASLLPRLRGGAPIHHAIIDGEEKTGITIMYMDKGMDTGDIISKSEYIIKDSDTVGTLHDTLSNIGVSLLKETLPKIVAGTNERIVQNHDEATFGYNITREDEHIVFNDTSRNVFNKVRGLNPWPTAYAIINEQEVKILECFISDKESTFSPGTICEINKDSFGISTKDKVVYITKVKPYGKKIMSAKDYLNGQNKEKLLHSIVE